MLNTTAMADDYFSTNYFGNEAWAGLSEETKVLVLSTAEIDVAAALRCDLDASWAVAPSAPYTNVQKAIFEWALYLQQNKSQIMRRMAGKSLGVESVEVEGVGKETYTTTSSNIGWYYSMMMNSRAGQFLRLITNDIWIVR